MNNPPNLAKEGMVFLAIPAGSFKTVMACVAESLRKHFNDLETSPNPEKVKSEILALVSALEHVFETDYYRCLDDYDWSFGKSENLNARIEAIQGALEALLQLEFQYVAEIEYPPMVRSFCDKYYQWMEDNYT